MKDGVQQDEVGGHAACAGSFVRWFGPLFNALRCGSPTACRSAADVTTARELLLALRSLPQSQKETFTEIVLHIGKDTDVSLSLEPKLSAMDAAELLEHCAGGERSADPGSVVMLRTALCAEASKADLRLLVSLVKSSDDALQCCIERLIKSCPPGSPPCPASPTACRLRPTVEVPSNVGERSSSPPTTRGPRIELPALTHPQPISVSHAPAADHSALSLLLWRASPTCSPSVATLLAKPFGVDAMPPAPLDPQHPQRVLESTPLKLVKRMMKDPTSTGFFADLKYDGERLIGYRDVPRNGGAPTYRFYSRNMLPVPERKLEGVRELLDGAFGASSAGGHSVVFDAEILSMHTFGSMNEVHKGIISVSGPRVYLFDLLWWNGHSLVSAPLTDRKELLHRILRPDCKNVVMSTCYWIPEGPSACSDLQLVFDDAMRKRLEGFVLKPSTSLYRYNGTDWVKLKKGYMAGDRAAGAAGFALFPGGPRIRRVDGVDVTTLAHLGGGHDAPRAETAKGPATAGATHRLFSKLVDTIDCLAVGMVAYRGQPSPPCVLLGLPDISANTPTIVTVGVAADPSLHCRLSVPTQTDVGSVATTRVALAGGTSLLLTPELLACAHVFVRESTSAESMQVVEVSGRGLMEDSQHTSGFAIVHADIPQVPRAPPGVIVRPRDDKGYRSCNTMQQVQVLFTYAVPTLAVHTAAGVQTARPVVQDAIALAIKGFNELHWHVLPPPSSTPQVPLGAAPRASIVSSRRSAAVAAKEGSPSASTMHVVLVPVVARKRWVNKGTMREVGAAFGPSVAELCNARLAIPSASSGDVVVVSPAPYVLCVVAALIQLVGPSPALEDASIVDITLVRVFGCLYALGSRDDLGIRKVVVHVDASSPSELAVWRSSLDSMLAYWHAAATPTHPVVQALIYQRYQVTS